ncbi:hypothetical protein JRQ81_000246 [Phrynocephalus forsythii]|uniref:Uncharacterized protein n=1 Tax=Phrynocephalus forsythii TaxID=171643 RepID=A0A9Q1B7U8_9SAUR|nr:hypothetical protein JRQ81_000246 [Phrynocephalus forsythii]
MKGRCVHVLVEMPSSLCLSPGSPAPESHYQDSPRQGQYHLNSSLVTMITMVRTSVEHGFGPFRAATLAESTLPEGGSNSPSRFTLATSDGMENSQMIDNILAAARKPSTLRLFSYK